VPDDTYPDISIRVEISYNSLQQLARLRVVSLAACGPADVVAYLDFIHLLGLPERLAVDVALILSSSQ
ncbi:MAG: hypothetical protein ACLUDS_07995, partial [Acutalibacteraceae bacterium]